jgi:hypothetical protein
MCLIKHYAMKAYGGAAVQIHIFLTSALAGDEWSASRDGRFTPGERALGTHRIGWVDPTASLEDVEKTLEPTRTRDSNSDSSVVQPVASRYTDYAIPAPYCKIPSSDSLYLQINTWQSIERTECLTFVFRIWEVP